MQSQGNGRAGTVKDRNNEKERVQLRNAAATRRKDAAALRREPCLTPTQRSLYETEGNVKKEREETARRAGRKEERGES